jgi:PTH1 family peptidyl-tRNA hydrolase
MSWLIVGLGNPGRKYEHNRHNVGFRVVDELARRHRAESFRDKFDSLFASSMIEHQKVFLQKPMEYMNHSGFPVQRAAAFHAIPIEQIVVIHDDIDLELGRTKLKDGGGHGGHNGLRSLIEQLGGRDFLRVRCGIGRPQRADGSSAPLPRDDQRVTGYVLGDFSREQLPTATALFDRAADAAEAILRHGMVAAMNQFNSWEGAADPG